MTRRERAVFKLAAHRLHNDADLLETWRRFDLGTEQSGLIIEVMNKLHFGTECILLGAVP